MKSHEREDIRERHVIKGKKNQLITPKLEKVTEGNKVVMQTKTYPFENLRLFYMHMQCTCQICSIKS